MSRFLGGAEGAVIDNLTGNFLFSTFGGANRVIVATGFISVVPEPTSLLLASLLAGVLVSCRTARRV